MLLQQQDFSLLISNIQLWITPIFFSKFQKSLPSGVFYHTKKNCFNIVNSKHAFCQRAGGGKKKNLQATTVSDSLHSIWYRHGQCLRR